MTLKPPPPGENGAIGGCSRGRSRHAHPHSSRIHPPLGSINGLQTVSRRTAWLHFAVITPAESPFHSRTPDRSHFNPLCIAWSTMSWWPSLCLKVHRDTGCADRPPGSSHCETMAHAAWITLLTGQPARPEAALEARANPYDPLQI